MAAVEQLVNLLCPGGQALLYVWALEQEKDKKKSNYLSESKIKGKADETSKCNTLDARIGDSGESACPNPTETLDVHVNRTHFEKQDLLVPWNLKANKSEEGSSSHAFSSNDSSDCASKLYHRYYHVFLEGEIEQLVHNLPIVTVVSSYYDKGNWCIIIEKTKGILEQ